MPTPLEWPATRYFAWLYSSAPQRRLLESLFGIEHEIASSLRPGLDHQVAHSRLQWWRDECERCAAGRPVHPLTRQLVAALGEARQSGVPPAPAPVELAVPQQAGTPVPQLAGLVGLVDTAIWDLACATFATRTQVTAYCERWSAAVVEPIGLRAASLSGQWRELGAALRELEMLTNVAREARRGRLRVPLDELEQAGENPQVLGHPPWPAAVATLLAERHAALRATLARTVSRATAVEATPPRGLLVWCALASRLSRRTQRALPEMPRSHRGATLIDSWQAWRAARQASSGRLRLE